MNYKETTLAGTSWTRCRCVTITNPLPGHGHIQAITGIEEGPTAFFQEEKVVSDGSVQTSSDAGSCRKAFDAWAAIPMLNPSTSEPTGASVTHAELYAILYSLYMQTATERDAA
jgi:hypothetical protein